MQKITVVAINLTRNRAFENLPFDQQTDEICVAVIRAYKQAKRLHPKHSVIAVWREYGLSNTFAVDDQSKESFKIKMAFLTKERDLTIIAGSLSSQKLVSSIHGQKKIEQILSAYNRYSFINQLESQTRNKKYFNEYKTNFSDNYLNNNFIKIENTCYIFNAGIKKYKREKIAPYQERVVEGVLPNLYSFKEQDWTYCLQTGDKTTSIVIEICREHPLGLVKYLIANHHVTAPNIHFILSDSDTFKPENASGDFNIRIDSDPDDNISFFARSQTLTNDVKLYTINPYQPFSTLKEIIPTELERLEIPLRSNYHITI